MPLQTTAPSQATRLSSHTNSSPRRCYLQLCSTEAALVSSSASLAHSLDFPEAQLLGRPGALGRMVTRSLQSTKVFSSQHKDCFPEALKTASNCPRCLLLVETLKRTQLPANADHRLGQLVLLPRPVQASRGGGQRARRDRAKQRPLPAGPAALWLAPEPGFSSVHRSAAGGPPTSPLEEPVSPGAGAVLLPARATLQAAHSHGAAPFPGWQACAYSSLCFSGVSRLPPERRRAGLQGALKQLGTSLLWRLTDGAGVRLLGPLRPPPRAGPEHRHTSSTTRHRTEAQGPAVWLPRRPWSWLEGGCPAPASPQAFPGVSASPWWEQAHLEPHPTSPLGKAVSKHTALRLR